MLDELRRDGEVRLVTKPPCHCWQDRMVSCNFDQTFRLQLVERMRWRRWRHRIRQTTQPRQNLSIGFGVSQLSHYS